MEEASQQARKSGKHLREVLQQNESVTKLLSSAELDRLFAPENYFGAAEELADRVIAASSTPR
jgi:adenylosuccinate lyase